MRLLRRSSVFSRPRPGVQCDRCGSHCFSDADRDGLPASGDLRRWDHVESVKSRITEAAPVPDPSGGACGPWALPSGTIWKPDDH